MMRWVCLAALQLMLILAASPPSGAESSPDTLTIAYNTGVAPLKFEDAAGKPAGLFPDLWRLWAQKTGRKIRFVKTDTFDASLQMVKDGTADLHAGLFKTAEREAFLDYSEPFLKLDYFIFTHPSIYPIRSLDRTSGLLVGVPRGGLTERYVRSRVPADRLIVYDSYNALFRAALEGEVKVFVATKLSLFYFLRENLLLNIFDYDEQTPLATQVYYTASQKGNLSLVQEINAGLAAIGDQEHKKLEEKWIVRREEVSDEDLRVSADIDLTAEEKAWLLANPNIRFTGDPDWLPQEAFTEEGQYVGIVANILELVENRLGLRIERVPVGTWSEAVGLAETGAVDVLSETTSSDREALRFTDPYLDFPVVIIAREGARTVSDPSELKGRRVAVVKGYGYVTSFRRQHPDLTYVEVETVREGLMSLSTGDIDAFISAAPTAYHLMSELGLTNLKFIGFTGLSIDLGFGVSRDKPLLVGILNKALASITDEEKFAIRQKWLPAIETTGPQPEGRISFTHLIVAGVVVFLILLLVARFLIKFIRREHIAVQFGSRWFRGFVLAGLSLFVIVVSLLGWFVLEQNAEKVKAAAGEDIREILETADGRLKLWMAQRKAFLKLLGRDPELVNLTKRLLGLEPGPGTLLASEILSDTRAFFKFHRNTIANTGFYIINRDHISIAAVRDASVGAVGSIARQRPDLLDRAFNGEILFVPPIKAGASSNGAPDQDQKKNAATRFLIGPIEDASGMMIAVLVLQLDTSREFTQLLPPSKTRLTGETYAFDEQGRLLSESRFNDQLRRIDLLADGQKSALNLEIRNPGVNLVEHQRPTLQRIQQPLTRMVSRALQLKHDMDMAGRITGSSKIETDIDGYRDYRGVPVYGAWLWNADLNLGLSTEIEVAEVLSNHRRIQRTVLGILAATLLISVGATILVLLIGERTSQALAKARDELEIRVQERTAELSASEEKSRLLLESVGEGIFGVDLKGRVAFINPSACRMLGYDSEDLLGKGVHEKIHHTRADGSPYPREECPMYMTYADGAEHHIDSEVLWCRDGTSFPVEYMSMPVKKDGEVVGAVVTFKDITERLRMEQEILAAKDKAEEATRAKSDFLANMSHEIRTPMNAVIGMTHLALKTDLTQKQRDYLTKIQSSANNLLGIINDILDFSKIEAGKLSMESVEFNLDDVLENLANLVTVKAQEKEELEVLFATEQAVPRHLVGDPLRLGQILINLVNNAVKFTEAGEIVVSTEIHDRGEDEVTLKFSVRDTGIGLTEQQIDKLFESFSQADTSTTRKFGGTGLGLSISRRLVEMMHGRIWVESDYGKGTTFSFFARFGIGRKRLRRRFETARDLQGLRVLVVDDNATSRNILQDILESFSFEVQLASTGEDGLEEIEKADRQKAFDLVLMDWKMPGMDGLEAAKKIKTHPRLKKTPAVILVTAYGREEIMQRSERLGLEGFLIKPVSPSVLFDTIMEAFGQETTELDGKPVTGKDIPLEHLQGAQVLLAEDNEINQQVAVEILQGAGLKVTVANNGLEAVQAVAARPFDAVLMDIQMPVMDGYTAARKIRQSASDTRDIPILAMTAHAMAGDEEKSLQAGMNGHITKPIDPDQLFAALAQWIQPGAKTGKAVAPVADNAAEAAEKADLPETLAGFDLAAGLKRLGGNKRLYRKLLMDFGNKYTHTAAEIRAALDAADFHQAHSLVHNLKGLAGNLEAGGLLAATREMEPMVKTGDGPAPLPEELDAAFAKLRDALEGALAAVQVLGCGVEAESEAGGGDGLPSVSPEVAKSAADRIRAAADIGDVMQVAAIAEELTSAETALAPFCDRIRQLADDFDLDGILKLADELMAQTPPK
jgi:PAS domain S-box-containing protein